MLKSLVELSGLFQCVLDFTELVTVRLLKSMDLIEVELNLENSTLSLSKCRSTVLPLKELLG
jgi:hypothetical protein